MSGLSARLGLAGALLLTPLASAAQHLVAHGEQGKLLAFEEDDRWSVEAGGGRLAVPLPAGGRLRGLLETPGGWLAAGTVDSPFGRELLFVEKGAGDLKRLPPPPRPVAPIRAEPVLLAKQDRIVGAAWLEGDAGDRNAIRFAALQGGAFGNPVEVGPAGPGSQLALAGTVLDDGRLLLVWAGFDGEDDEIWGVVGDGTSWSAPARIGGDNHVPDILPAVIATAGGALIAWSRFDAGEYRLALSSFDGRSFGDARLIGSPGTLDPTFERVDGAPALLYRDARTRSWALTELPRPGALGRTARADGSSDERPAVAGDRAGVVWRFGSRTVASGWR